MYTFENDEIKASVEFVKFTMDEIVSLIKECIEGHYE